MTSHVSRRTLIAAGAAVPLAACTGPAEPELGGIGGDVLLTNAVVFDGERFSDHDSVAVRGGRIAEVGQGLSGDGLDVFDCGGRVLLPGLIDAHTHMSADHAGSAIRFGVTALLDMHGRIITGSAARRDSLDEHSRSDIWWADWGVTVPGGHPTQLGSGTPTVEDFDSVAAFVAARVEAGADHIKLFIQTEGFPATLSPEQASEAVSAAHAHDRLAVAHVGDWHDARIAAEAGVDVLVHLPIGGDVDHDVVGLLAARPTPVVATLHVISGDRCNHAYADFLEDHTVSQRLDHWQRQDATDPSGCEEATAEQIAEFRVHPDESVAALREAGVPILAGTDLGNPGTVAGLSMYTELEMLVSAGLGAEEALAGATSRTADAFGLADRGRIAAEGRADMVLLEATDPDQVIGAYGIVAVWKNGHAVDLEPER
jgi:imidazolonepropionase-like amidohydrolase